DVPVRLDALAGHHLLHPRRALCAELRLLARISPGDPGVVHQHVQRGEIALDLREHGLDLPAVGDVGSDRATRRRAHAEAVARHLRRVEADVVHDDPRAFLGEELRDRPADAGASAGHESDSTVELHRGYLPTPAVSSTSASSRKCGMTSRANSSIISSVFSCVPAFMPEQPMPAWSSSEKIRSLSRTVAGLPTMM